MILVEDARELAAFAKPLQADDFFKRLDVVAVAADKEDGRLSGVADFVQIAAGFGVAGERVIKREDLKGALQKMIDHDGPYVLDIVVPYTEHVLPMIKQGLSAKEILISSE